MWAPGCPTACLSVLLSSLQVSREIIKRCKAKISLEDIFEGFVERSTAVLQECIACCASWKGTYEHLVRVYVKFSKDQWVLDHISIFAQVDAFMQRCKDLLDVCEGQVHFGHRSEGKRQPVPPFAGVTGPSIVKSLEEIEATFDKYLSSLRSVRHCILDVKATSWHDNYNRFRAGIKDLEVMMQNAIGSAFQAATTVQAGVEILEYFVHLSTREVGGRVHTHTHTLLNTIVVLPTLCLLYTPTHPPSHTPPLPGDQEDHRPQDSGPLCHVQRGAQRRQEGVQLQVPLRPSHAASARRGSHVGTRPQAPHRPPDEGPGASPLPAPCGDG